MLYLFIVHIDKIKYQLSFSEKHQQLEEMEDYTSYKSLHHVCMI